MSMSLPVSVLKCGADVSFSTPSITNGGRATFTVRNYKDDGDLDFKRCFDFLVEDAGQNIETKVVKIPGPLGDRTMSSASVSGDLVVLKNEDGNKMEVPLEEWDSVLKSLEEQYGGVKFPHVKT